MPLKPPTAQLPEIKTPIAKTTNRAHDDSVRALYKTARWLKFAEMVKAYNPVCQRIVNGEQCHSAAKIIHHILSPKKCPSLFLDWRNVVGVCTEHHPDSSGEPLNIPVPNRYAITKGIMGATYDSNVLIAKLRDPLTVGIPTL
jgi:hypothetical protein